jgi:hypothetical protein
VSDDYRHLAWADATQLSARLVALPIFQHYAPGSDEAEVLKRLFKPSGVGAEGKSTSQELLDRLDKADQHINTLEAPVRAQMKRPMLALRRAVRKVNCADCSLKSAHQCNGASEDKDDRQLDQPGLCIKLLHDLFQDVVTRYAQWIDRWVFDGEVEHRTDLTLLFSTRAHAEYAYDRAGPEWKICGSTRFVDPLQGRVSLIKLSISYEELDWSSLCAAFWILVHEFVCHAQQGGPTASARVPCLPSCHFFEGWMDEIANRLLLADLDAGLFSKTACDFVKNNAPSLRQAAEGYRNNRYGWCPGDRRHKYAAQWDLGVKAVAAVDRFLQSFDADERSATSERSLPPLLRLSFRIVAAAPNPKQAEKLVIGLLTAAYSAPRKGIDLAGRLYALITGPIGDLYSWINELQDIVELSDM